MTRLADWPERLARYIAAHRAAAFDWGTCDCALFAAGDVQAITGADVLPARWSNRVDAARLLRAAGGLVAAVDAVLPRLAAPSLAWRGDIVLVQSAQRPARRWLAVCDGARAWAPSRAGLVAAPVAAAVMAWGVGHG